MEMVASQDPKPVIKAAYLTQLRHGPFTESEIVSNISQAQLREAVAQGYLVQDQNNGAHYSLSDAGRSKITVVLAGGVYDVLHLGHLAALSEAKSFGDVLVAVVATDVTAEMLKGRKPIFPEEDRRQLVEGL